MIDKVELHYLLQRLPRSEFGRRQYLTSLVYKRKADMLPKDLVEVFLQQSGLRSTYKDIEGEMNQCRKWEGSYSKQDYGDRPLAGGVMELDVLGEYDYRAKALDIRSLRCEIPNYIDLLQIDGARVRKVYLLEYVLKVIDVTTLQPLFKAVVEFERSSQLYIIGRDRYTREPFALGVPNGFVGFSIEVCLRWTMDLHKGDEAIEV